jgi:hypothetical protein
LSGVVAGIHRLIDPSGTTVIALPAPRTIHALATSVTFSHAPISEFQFCQWLAGVIGLLMLVHPFDHHYAIITSARNAATMSASDLVNSVGVLPSRLFAQMFVLRHYFLPRG